MAAMDNQANQPVRVGMISLGCAKNLVDAEIMLGMLAREGMEITNDAALADVVIVNTCSFIDAAQEESVDTILESAQVREIYNRGQGLVVAGCLPQRFRDELPALIPEVDAFMGIDQVPQVTQIIKQAITHRAERLQQPSLAGRRPRRKIISRLAELQAHGAGEPVAALEAANSITSPMPRRGNPVFLAAQPEANRQGRPATPPVDAATPLLSVNARPVYIPDYATPRFRLTPNHFAYLKIAEGCNHPCSFCIIPRIRGTHRSRAQADVVQEARLLLESGVKELNLISQDTTYYGLDLRPERQGRIASPEKFQAATQTLPATATTLCSLLRELNTLPGQFWIRLLYTHPAHWTDELIQTIVECPKVARYVDMPLQHIHPVMLERMRRETSENYILELIKKMRARIPGLTLRTTFIVGFPGESEAYFQHLLDFIAATRFERLGIFTYSQEEATRAAKMSGQVPERVKQRRRELAMAAQLKVARQVTASFQGRAITVLVEHEAQAKELRQAQVASWEHGLVRGRDQHQDQLHGRYLVARGEGDAPDIDGRVYVRGGLPPGNFAQVNIVGHTDYDLIAEA